jgi:hypothetical protein
MVIGMGGTQAGETQLLAWLKDTAIGERNWLLKGLGPSCMSFRPVPLVVQEQQLLPQSRPRA